MKTLTIILALLIAGVAEAKTTRYQGDPGTTDTRCMKIPKNTKFEWYVVSTALPWEVNYFKIRVWDCQRQIWFATPVFRLSTAETMIHADYFYSRRADGWLAFRVETTGHWALDVTTPRKRKQKRRR